MKRTTVSLAGDVLSRVETERDRLAALSSLEPSLSEVAIALIKDGLQYRETRAKKGAKS